MVSTTVANMFLKKITTKETQLILSLKCVHEDVLNTDTCVNGM